MDRRVYVLTTRDRRKAVSLIVGALERNSRVEISGPQRNLDQNRAMWAALTDVSEQHAHNGVSLSPADWRLVFLDAYWRHKNAELRLVPNLDGTGFVPLSGRSTSELSAAEMSELLDLIHATGAGWGVRFHDDPEPAAIDAEFTVVQQITDGRDAGAERQVNSHPAGRAA